MQMYQIVFIAVRLAADSFAVSIIEPVIVIGIVIFILSLTGIDVGEFFGHVYEDKI